MPIALVIIKQWPMLSLVRLGPDDLLFCLFRRKVKKKKWKKQWKKKTGKRTLRNTEIQDHEVTFSLNLV